MFDAVATLIRHAMLTLMRYIDMRTSALPRIATPRAITLRCGYDMLLP